MFLFKFMSFKEKQFVIQCKLMFQTLQKKLHRDKNVQKNINFYTGF